MKLSFHGILYFHAQGKNDKGHFFSYIWNVALMITMIKGIVSDTQLTRDFINICWMNNQDGFKRS